MIYIKKRYTTTLQRIVKKVAREENVSYRDVMDILTSILTRIDRKIDKKFDIEIEHFGIFKPNVKQQRINKMRRKLPKIINNVINRAKLRYKKQKKIPSVENF